MARTLPEIARTLVEYCRTGQEDRGLTELYARDAVSVEAMAGPGMDSRETAGVDAIRGKHAWWNENFEVISADVEGPFLHGDDRFGVIFTVKGKSKQDGSDFDMREVAVYHVKDGRITREEFFYGDGSWDEGG